MAVGLAWSDSSSRLASPHSALERIRLVHILDGVARFGQGGGQGFDSHRSSIVAVDDDPQETPIHFVQASGVDAQSLAGETGDGRIDGSRSLHLGEVARSAQDSVGYPRRSPRTLGNFEGAGIVDGGAEHARAP